MSAACVECKAFGTKMVSIDAELSNEQVCGLEAAGAARLEGLVLRLCTHCSADFWILSR